MSIQICQAIQSYWATLLGGMDLYSAGAGYRKAAVEHALTALATRVRNRKPGSFLHATSYPGGLTDTGKMAWKGGIGAGVE